MSTILGLDPSTVASGWALLVLDGAPGMAGGQESIAASGVYKPTRLSSPAEMRHLQPHDLLLREAYFFLRGLADIHDVDLLAIETPFFKLNARTLVTLAQVGAAFRLAATLDGIPVLDVPPMMRCTALSLPGNASKRQVLSMVNAVYNLNLTDHNEADAVAVAAAGAVQWRERQLRGGQDATNQSSQ